MTTSIVVDETGEAIQGDLVVPKGATGVVIFAHGSGSGRFSPRNRFVAERLQKASLATFLIDLLTEREERVDDVTGRLRFDIPLLAERLESASRFLRADGPARSLPQGYFGASTGAAAALIAAARRPDVFAVVSRGGRPDLAGDFLGLVRAPTLLIVGGDDSEVLELNREAKARLRCESRLEIVPGATHLFEEPGALERVAGLAADWFAGRLAAGGGAHVRRPR